ncbi:hypothetical protein [Micromonospora sp. NPDC050276]|uniref:hypothetical protein n=1 Tax=Micromonospora sp. NPDC050276 TaxID=3364278 RepID=UPI00379D4F6A
MARAADRQERLDSPHRGQSQSLSRAVRTASARSAAPSFCTGQRLARVPGAGVSGQHDHRALGTDAVSSAATAMPSRPGISRSTTTTSGRYASVAVTAEAGGGLGHHVDIRLQAEPGGDHACSTRPSPR